MRYSISMPSCAIPSIPTSYSRSTIVAITSILLPPVTRRWEQRSHLIFLQGNCLNSRFLLDDASGEGSRSIANCFDDNLTTRFDIAQRRLAEEAAVLSAKLA